jgi:hypothetical protein
MMHLCVQVVQWGGSSSTVVHGYSLTRGERGDLGDLGPSDWGSIRVRALDHPPRQREPDGVAVLDAGAASAAEARRRLAITVATTAAPTTAMTHATTMPACTNKRERNLRLRGKGWAGHGHGACILNPARCQCSAMPCLSELSQHTHVPSQGTKARGLFFRLPPGAAPGTMMT